MAADNTAGFNCRTRWRAGPPHWSVHAYGEAIDVNTVENPYIEGGQVHPPTGAAYIDRSDIRPGMAYPGGQLVAAFAAVGLAMGRALERRPTTSTSRPRAADARGRWRLRPGQASGGRPGSRQLR